MNISFTPLKVRHFPLLLRWLLAPHVRAWWDKDVAWTPELIEAKYAPYVEGVKRLTLPDRVIEKPIHAFIIQVDGEDIGYIQYYNAYDFPPEQGYTLEGFPENLASFDILIGEPQWLNKGLGSQVLNRFLTEHVFPHFSACFVSVETDNTRALRAYEKAGFSAVTTIQQENLTLMLKGKEDYKK